MTLWSKIEKVWRGRSKGVSTVVGTVFLMLIIFMVSTNVILWTFSQNAQYNVEVMARNREDVDRLSEEIVATNGIYSVVSTDRVNVEAELSNKGSVAGRVVSLWVFDNTTQTYGFNNTLGPLNLNVGDIIPVSISVTIQDVSTNHEFHSWFITARGNKVEVTDMYEVMSQLISQGGVGPMIYNFYNFRYYMYDGNKLQDYPTGIESFEVPNNEQIAFGITLTNLDAEKRDMTITSYTHLWVTSDSASMNQWKRFYVVDIDSDGTVSSHTTTVIPYGQTELIVLASGKEGLFQKQSLPSSHFPDDTVQGTYLLVYGFFEGDSFAQNVPFVAFFMT